MTMTKEEVFFFFNSLKNSARGGFHHWLFGTIVSSPTVKYDALRKVCWERSVRRLAPIIISARSPANLSPTSPIFPRAEKRTSRIVDEEGLFPGHIKKNAVVFFVVSAFTL